MPRVVMGVNVMGYCSGWMLRDGKREENPSACPFQLGFNVPFGTVRKVGVDKRLVGQPHFGGQLFEVPE